MTAIKPRWVFVLLVWLAVAGPVSADGIHKIYILGDSLSDQGNLFAATELVGGPGMGIPADDFYYLGRFSDAGNYADVLADKLNVVVAPTSMGGTNYAYGGARTDYNRVENDASKPPPVNLLGQGGTLPADLFPWTLAGQQAEFAGSVMDPDALYIVFSGANDISDLTIIMARALSGDARFNIDPNVFIAKVVAGINDAIGAFVAAGARDIIVPYVPNLGVVPSVTAFGSNFAALATTLSLEYNQALRAMLAQWEGQTNIIPVDTFGLLTQVVENPAAFGFENVTEPCYTGFVLPADGDIACPNPQDYPFWDIEHPTTAFHTLMAEFMLATAARDILADLLERIAALDAQPGIKQSLAAKLNAVLMSMDDGKAQNDGAINGVLQAFIDSAKAKSGTKLTPDDSAMLVERIARALALMP